MKVHVLSVRLPAADCEARAELCLSQKNLRIYIILILKRKGLLNENDSAKMFLEKRGFNLKGFQIKSGLYKGGVVACICNVIE